LENGVVLPASSSNLHKKIIARAGANTGCIIQHATRTIAIDLAE